MKTESISRSYNNFLKNTNNIVMVFAKSSIARANIICLLVRHKAAIYRAFKAPIFGKVMVTGECNCGSVAFEITSNISDVFICHCSICRRSTGSNGIAVTVVNISDFRWVRGETLINTWHKPGHDWQTSFCQTCGSSLPGINDESRMYVPAGLVTEGGENLKAAHHIWVDSKATWDEISDNGKQHQKAFAS